MRFERDFTRIKIDVYSAVADTEERFCVEGSNGNVGVNLTVSLNEFENGG